MTVRRPDPAPVLVVGAGPVGLTLAWRLARAGRQVRVFEADEGITSQLRASTFHPPTLDMLEDDGITTALLAAGRVTPGWQIRIHETGERVTFDLGVLADDTGHPYRLQCHQAELSRRLMRQLRSLDVEVAFGSRVTSVGQDDTHAFATLEDGRRVTGSHLVGCEGARSVTREAIGADFEGAAYPETTVLATTEFPFESVMPDLAGVNYVWKAGGTFSLLRLPDCWRCSFQARDDQDEAAATSPAALQAHLREILPTHADSVDVIETRAYRVHRRLASRWRLGRLFIAGDAAHLNSPKGGMGLNGGIHDAFALADALLDGTEAALAHYEHSRRPVVDETIIGQADRNRARMAITDENSRRAELERLRAITHDHARLRDFRLESSMIAGLRRAAQPAAGNNSR